MALITCTGAAFGYEGETVVSGLDFAVQPGDYLCIVGENGAGKTTLIKGILRLIRPLRGTLAVDEGLAAAEVGYLPQQTAAQKDFPAGAEEVVLSGCLNRSGLRPWYTKAEKAAARANMERLGIWGLRGGCYRELSGGQQQRVLLARALCATSRLLLLDEPATGLDPRAAQELYRLVQEINRDMGITVLMVSHDVKTAVGYASHILHLQHSQMFFGPSGEYLATDLGKSFVGRDADA